MDKETLAFIRDRFNSLETNSRANFEDVKDLISNITVDLNKKIADNDNRITKLEEDSNIQKGKVAAYGVIGGGLFSLIVALFKALV